MPSSTVSDLYNHYPFPQPQVLLHRPLRASFLKHVLALSGVDFTVPKEILIAGCGTIEALEWASTFPESRITAVDFSHQSLQIQKKLAGQLGMNISFHEMDLRKVGDLGQSYDFISSYGVLHHLENPLEGLSALKQVLKKDGIMRLMLYNQQHRLPYKKIQNIIEKSTKEKNTVASRSWADTIQQSLPILEALTRFPHRLLPQAQEMFTMMQKDTPAVMDTLFHPQEHSYSIHELFELLEKAELPFIGFENPWEWSLERYFPPQVLSHFSALSPQDRAIIIDDLIAPFFVFFVGVSPPRMTPQTWETMTDWKLALCQDTYRQLGETVGGSQPIPSQITPIPGKEAYLLRHMSAQIEFPALLGEWLTTIKEPRSIGDFLADLTKKGHSADTIYRILQNIRELIYTIRYCCPV